MTAEVEIRTPGAGERSAIIELSNRVFRSDREGRMEREYPILFSEENLCNWRIAQTPSGEVVSAAGLWPGEILIEGKKIAVGSLGSVCTDREYRGRGIASRVIGELERHALGLGLRLFFVSGEGGLYDRFGAVKAGRFAIGEVAQEEGEPRGVRIERLSEEDAEFVEDLNRREATRYVRSPELLRRLIARGHLCDRPFIAYRIEDEEGRGAYAAVALPLPGKSSDRVIVEEYGGDRTLLARALGSIGGRLRSQGILSSEEPFLIRFKSDETELENLLGRTLSLEPFPGTVKVIDPEGFLNDMGGASVETGLPPLSDKRAWTLLLFGSPQSPPSRSAACGLRLPLPLVSYGFSYV